MVFPIVRKTLVEVGIFFLSDIFFFSHPNRLLLVLEFEFISDLLDFLLLLFFRSIFLLFVLDFDIFSFLFLFFILLFFLFLFFRLFFIVTDFSFGGLFNLKLNFKADEF